MGIRAAGMSTGDYLTFDELEAPSHSYILFLYYVEEN